MVEIIITYCWITRVTKVVVSCHGRWNNERQEVSDKGRIQDFISGKSIVYPTIYSFGFWCVVRGL